MDSKITYHQQVSYCGKERCRKCRAGIGHGPYWYAYQIVKGRTVRTYVGKNPPPELENQRKPVHSGAASGPVGTALRLYTLGRVRMEKAIEGSDGPIWEPVIEPLLQHQRVRSLLACLVSTPGRKLGREQVMYMLWPEQDPETATNRLDRAVHDLRQVLEPGRARSTAPTLLASDHSMLVLADQTSLWIDADSFEHLLALARSANDPGEVEQLLEEAANLYENDFLHSEVAIETVINRRESLRRAWITVLLELADLRMTREALASAVEVLDRLLAADATNEAAAQRMIALLAQMGRRNEAIATYQRLSEALQAEFEIAPLPETRVLFDAALSGAPLPRLRNQIRLASTSQSELSSLTRATPPEHMNIGRTPQSPLVGREEEMASLHQMLQRTEQARKLRLTGQKKPSVFAPLSMDNPRRAQFGMLLGDVGIGKTRLAEETAREAKRHDWAVAWCRAYTQEGHIPYRVWIEILRKAMAQGLWQRQELTRRPLLFQPLGNLLPELQDILPGVLYTPPIPPEQEQLRLWEATRELLLMICENTTLLVVLDDVQWADIGSCELLAYLARQMRGAPIMFLCTCREVDMPEDHLLRTMMTDMTREQSIEILPLKPLHYDLMRELIGYLPPSALEPILRQAGGNPFFAEELAQSAAVGHLILNGSEINTTALPTTISAVLEMRLGRLTEPCLHLLERAAVLGDMFFFETICAMSSAGQRADEEEVLDWLEEAMQAGMLSEEGQGAHVTFTFWHPLLQTYLYEHLSAARRGSLHRRAAQVLIEFYANRVSEGAAEITRHLIGGGGPAAEIAYYAELAADRAYTLSTYPVAEKHYAIVLRYLGELDPRADQPTRLHYAYLYEQMGECSLIVGKFEAARTAYEQELDLRATLTQHHAEERAYEAQRQALLCCELGKVWHRLGESTQARASVTRGEELLRAAGVKAGPAWARIRYQQGHTCWLEGKLDEALDLAREALQRFQASQPLSPQTETPFLYTQAQRIMNGDPIGYGRVYMLLAGVEIFLGKSADALDHLNQALDVFEKNDIKRDTAIIYSNLGDIYLRKAEYTQAKDAFEQAIETTEKIGDIPSMSVALGNMGVLAARLGSLTEAENWHRQALDLVKTMSEPFYTSLFHSYVATALIEQGKLDEAQAPLVQALRISHAKQIAPCTGFALAALGRLRFSRALAADRPQHELDKEASQEVREHVDYLLCRARTTLQRALTYDGLEADVRLDAQLLLGRIALMLDESELARELAQAVLDEAVDGELIWLQARAHSLLGLIIAQLEGPPAALASFAKALEIFESTGMQLEYARALYAQATVLLEHRVAARRRQGMSDLKTVRPIFKRCQAMLDLHIAEQLVSIHISHEELASAREATQARIIEKEERERRRAEESLRPKRPRGRPRKINERQEPA